MPERGRQKKRVKTGSGGEERGTEGEGSKGEWGGGSDKHSRGLRVF